MVIGERTPPSILKLLSVAALGLSVMAYVSIAVNSEDLLWFWPAFDGQPESVLAYCGGQVVEVQPGSPAFERLVRGLNQGLWGWKQWSTLSLSTATWVEYRWGADSLVLEFRYSPPVKVHSYYRFFKDIDTLIVPLVGRNANAFPVFGLRNGRPGAGALHLDTNAPLLEIVQTESICP